MQTQPPPGRYRVVERGRRLVVVDTLTGAEASPGPAAVPSPALPQGPERRAFDGRATLVTHPFYDAKGPRTLDLDPGAAALLARLKGTAAIAAAVLVALAIAEPLVLIAVPVLLLNAGLRKRLRGAATRWLDRYDPGESRG